VLLTTGSRRRPTSLERAAYGLIVRHPASRAGFHFAIATLFRSKTHRLTLAAAAAVGVAMVLVVLSRTELQPGQLSQGVLVIQPLLYGSLMVAFRHLIRVPAELRANWAVQLAWRHHPRAFTAGVRRAAMLTLALPAMIAVLPIVSLAGGFVPAVTHAIVGLAGAAILLEALMLGYEKAPFTCTYVPGTGRVLVPMFVLAFILGASLFARLQLAILAGTFTIGGLTLLLIVFAGLRVATLRGGQPAIDFDESPASFHQLGLHN
jgi:hypothetical protein